MKNIDLKGKVIKSEGHLTCPLSKFNSVNLFKHFFLTSFHFVHFGTFLCLKRVTVLEFCCKLELEELNGRDLSYDASFSSWLPLWPMMEPSSLNLRESTFP